MGGQVSLLTNQTAVVTGGAQGLGYAIAERFIAEGAQVVLGDLDLAATEAAAERLGPDATIAVRCDVTKADEVDALVAAAVQHFGGLDIMVNNAGITRDATMRKMTEQQFDDVIEINLKGVYNCTRAVVDTMLKQQSGVILNASSIVGLYGNFGQTNYAASKFGVIGMVKTWAKELGRKGIRANAVCPGFIETAIIKSVPERVIRALEERVPLGRLGRPEEIANTFAFLASDEASYINGAVIEVSGGLTL